MLAYLLEFSRVESIKSAFATASASSEIALERPDAILKMFNNSSLPFISELRIAVIAIATFCISYSLKDTPI